MSTVQLSPEQLEDLKELEKLHSQIGAEIGRAESAGLDMSDYRAKLEQLESTRAGLLKVYGGTQRRRKVG